MPFNKRVEPTEKDESAELALSEIEADLDVEPDFDGMMDDLWITNGGEG